MKLFSCSHQNSTTLDEINSKESIEFFTIIFTIIFIIIFILYFVIYFLSIICFLYRKIKLDKSDENTGIRIM